MAFNLRQLSSSREIRKSVVAVIGAIFKLQKFSMEKAPRWPYSGLSVFKGDKESWEQVSRLPPKISIFGGFISDSIFNQHKYITVNFQMECIELQSKIWLSFFLDFYKPIRNIPCFTFLPYSCHLFLTVLAFVN